MYLSPLSQFIIYDIVYGITNYTYHSIIGILFIVNSIVYLRSITLCYLLRALIDTVYTLSIKLLGIRIEIHYLIQYNILILIIIYNLIGLMPYAFTITSHYSLTLGMSLFTIISCTLIGIIRNTYSILTLLLPIGTPISLSPLLIIIETISYISRAISLGLRLGANIITGHTLMLILSQFTTYPIITIPLVCIIYILYIMELCIAVLQAYVYILLNNSYIYDTVYLH